MSCESSRLFSVAVAGLLSKIMGTQDDVSKTVACDTGEEFRLISDDSEIPGMSAGKASCYLTKLGSFSYLPGLALDERVASWSFDAARRHCVNMGDACSGVTLQPCSVAKPGLYTLRASVKAVASDRGEISWLKQHCSAGRDPLVDIAVERKSSTSDDGDWCVIGNKVLAFYTGKIWKTGTQIDCKEIDSQCWFPAYISYFTVDGNAARVRWEDGDDEVEMLPTRRLLKYSSKNWCTTSLHGSFSYLPQLTTACTDSNHQALSSLCQVWVDVVEQVMSRFVRQWTEERCVQVLSTNHSLPACYAPYYDHYWKSLAHHAKECWSLTTEQGVPSLMECLREMVFIALAGAKHAEQFDEIKQQSTQLFNAIKKSELSFFFPWENLYQTPYFIQNFRPFAEFDPAVFLLPAERYTYRSPKNMTSGWYDTSSGFLGPIVDSLSRNFLNIKRELQNNLLIGNESLWECITQPVYRDTVLAVQAQAGRCTYGIWGTQSSWDEESVQSSCAFMPTLCNALRPHLPTTDHPRYAEGLGLARLKPNGNVPIHRDPHRCFLFMCLSGCKSAVMQIGPTLHEYGEGVAISFDGSVDHGMWNTGTSDRVVVQMTLSSLDYHTDFDDIRHSPNALVAKNDRFLKRYTDK